jgi:hypothetical protein
MSTSDYDVRSTGDINFDDANAAGADRARDMKAKVGGMVNRGIDTVKDQYRVVREQGMQGVKDDVVGYAKREPMKALLLAGGIGALAAMILRRR